MEVVRALPPAHCQPQDGNMFQLLASLLKLFKTAPSSPASNHFYLCCFFRCHIRPVMFKGKKQTLCPPCAVLGSLTSPTSPCRGGIIFPCCLLDTCYNDCLCIIFPWLWVQRSRPWHHPLVVVAMCTERQQTEAHSYMRISGGSNRNVRAKRLKKKSGHVIKFNSRYACYTNTNQLPDRTSFSSTHPTAACPQARGSLSDWTSGMVHFGPRSSR